MKTQFGELITADLLEGTLTIKVGETIIAQAGKYAIVPIEDYEKLVSEDKTRNESERVCSCDDPKPHKDSTDGMLYCMNCGCDIKQT